MIAGCLTVVPVQAIKELLAEFSVLPDKLNWGCPIWDEVLECGMLSQVCALLGSAKKGAGC